MERRARIYGLLIGCAVGDAVGLPREGLRPGRAARLYGPPPLEHRLLFGRGMVSDDTEHTCMVAASLARRWPDDEAALHEFAWRLRAWMLALPPGVGLGTLRAVGRLLLGFGPGRSGVRTAGNGPTMRAAVLAVPPDDEAALRARVRAFSRITHTDPLAEQGALLVALGARLALTRPPGAPMDPTSVAARLAETPEDPALRRSMALVRDLLAEGAAPEVLAARLGLERGVTGFVLHTAPAAIYCWLRYPDDARAAIEAAIALGGDADTVGAITGALAGATVGAEGLPASWVEGLKDWPWGPAGLAALADGLSALEPGAEAGPRSLALPGEAARALAAPARNLLMLAAVLVHVARRWAPPWGE